MIYTLVSVGTLFTVLYFYFIRTFDYWKKRNVAGPKPLPFFGNLKDSFLRRKSIIMVYSSIYESFPNEKIVGIYRMTTPCLLLRDLDVIKNVMIKDFELFADRGIEFSDEGLGVNLFHADGDRWRVLRNRFTPLFTSGKLKNMLLLMSKCGDKFLNYVDEICHNQPEQSMHLVFQHYTMSSIAACAFGVDIDRDMEKTLEKIDKLVFSVNYGIELDMMYPGILKKFNSSLFPNYVTKFFENLTKNVIEQRRGIPSNRKDFIDLILELRQKKIIEGAKRSETEDVKVVELTDNIIAAQTFVFYVAGYETGASVLSYLFYELAKNPDIQDKLIAEIDNVLEDYDELNYECLSKMTYMGQVLDETLRKYPMGDLLLRKAKTDYTIPDTNVTIREGQTIIISAWGVHHDPKHYPDPDIFDPERFSPENVKNRHSCAYLAFGVGPRNCLGIRFAKLQSKVCVVKFLSKFRVEISKKTPSTFKYDPMRLFAFPIDGIYLNIVRRQV